LTAKSTTERTPSEKLAAVRAAAAKAAKGPTVAPKRRGFNAGGRRKRLPKAVTAAAAPANRAAPRRTARARFQDRRVQRLSGAWRRQIVSIDEQEVAGFQA